MRLRSWTWDYREQIQIAVGWRIWTRDPKPLSHAASTYTFQFGTFSMTMQHSCFAKGCPTKVSKCMWQCWLVSWVRVLYLICLIEVQGDLARRKEKAWICMNVLFPSTTLRHLELQSSNHKITISHNNFRHCPMSICKTTFLQTAVFLCISLRQEW